MIKIHRTKQHVDIYVERGAKSQNDFIVKYQEVGKRLRTPKHIHLIVDLFEKRTGNPALTNMFVDYVINEIILKINQSQTYPPALQVFDPSIISAFAPLEQFGDYSIEFLLIVIELIMIQEKTNYPAGVLNLHVFRKFRDGADIFSVVGAATFRGIR